VRARRLKKSAQSPVVEGVQGVTAAGEATIGSLTLLYQQRYHRFLRVAEAILGDPELAHDVVQDAFARAIRGRSGFRGEGDLEAWVWRIVVNTARSAGREQPPPGAVLDEVAVTNGQARDPELRALVAALPERQRLVLFLRYYAELDYRQIAEAIDVQPGTVGATLHQAHAALRKALEEGASR
jgi:RNA polymerase sigma factor (sigma-70 family)